MKVKGAAVSSTMDYVKNNFPDQYDTWLESLPETTKKILEGFILPNNWYPAQKALIEPAKAICDHFFDGNVKGAWDSRKISVTNALTGIYKVFVIECAVVLPSLF